MIFNPRTPVVVGALLIGGLVGTLTFYSPLPGDLSRAHARVDELTTLAGCESCHAPEGFTAGCLGCHTEINSQLAVGRGYHHHLLEETGAGCVDCHQEHNGAHHELAGQLAWGAQIPRAFKHPHVDFSLVGAHEHILCEKCHFEKLREPLALQDFPATPRHRTFLGLGQACMSCHEDVHAAGLSGRCDECHGQDEFSPTPHFDHTSHFPLDGGHADVECKGCHSIPHPESPRRPSPFPFDHVRGKLCVECHETPHRAPLAGRCDSCHDSAAPEWSRAMSFMTREVHAVTGFQLDAPHEEVECIDCHPSELAFEERYRDPTAPGYRRHDDTCGGCHPDVHYGQFNGRYDKCTDCHGRLKFLPTTYDHVAHARSYPLNGAHQAVACTSCHLVDPATRVTKFVGTVNQCKVCHKNPHGSQFAREISTGDCDACHDVGADDFGLRPFEHKTQTGYALEGAHSRATCESCHVQILDRLSTASTRARRYRDTPTACSSCHVDVHRGQFQDYGEEGCSTCHSLSESWSEIRFDHDQQARFPLRGAHSRVACSRCHQSTRLEDDSEIVHYKPLGRECTDCHDILPK